MTRPAKDGRTAGPCQTCNGKGIVPSTESASGWKNCRDCFGLNANDQAKGQGIKYVHNPSSPCACTIKNEYLGCGTTRQSIVYCDLHQTTHKTLRTLREENELLRALATYMAREACVCPEMGHNIRPCTACRARTALGNRSESNPLTHAMMFGMPTMEGDREACGYIVPASAEQDAKAALEPTLQGGKRVTKLSGRELQLTKENNSLRDKIDALTAAHAQGWTSADTIRQNERVINALVADRDAIRLALRECITDDGALCYSKGENTRAGALGRRLAEINRIARAALKNTR